MAALIALAGAAITGCSGAQTDGPLLLGGEPGALCVPAAAGQSVGVGEVLSVASDSPAVTISAVELSGAEHVSEGEAYLVPMDGANAVMSMYPDDPPKNWSERTAAAGATISPGETVNLLTLIERTSNDPSGLDSITVVYTAGNGTQYEARSTTEVDLADDCN